MQFACKCLLIVFTFNSLQIFYGKFGFNALNFEKNTWWPPVTDDIFDIANCYKFE